MGWEYQNLVRKQAIGKGLKIKGNKPLVGAITNENPRIYNILGEIKLGKGTIIYSSFNILPKLLSSEKASAVPQRVFWNMLHYAQKNKPGNLD